MTELFASDGTPRTPNGGTKEKPTFVSNRSCQRCGGLGGSDKWGPHGSNTGWTCYRCGGSGVDPSPQIDKLYSAEKLEKLVAAQLKRDAKKTRVRAAADAAEAERRRVERAEVISENADLLAMIDAELAYGDIEILQSVRLRVAEAAKHPSEKQVEIVTRIVKANAAERKRREKAAHVGVPKERRDFTLTLLFTTTREALRYPYYLSHWSLFTDENGCKVACKSAPHVIGLVRDRETKEYTKAQTIRVKATVVEHTTDKNGEPVTYINRPKRIE